MELASQIIQGVLTGGLYALYALGLSLSVGVIRLVNLAHGDFIVLASYLLLTMVVQWGINPWLATLIVIPIAFAAGYVLQRTLLERVIGRGILPPLLVTFGLSIVIQNALLTGFGADTRRISAGGFETATIAIGGINLGLLSLTILATAIVLVVALETMLYRTSLGARIRAVSDDVGSANLIGLPSAGINAIAMGIIGITVAIAAAFTGISTNFDPTTGPGNLLIAFEAVVLGGLGSLWGTLAGGIIIGVAQAVGAQIDIGWQALAGHIVFLAIFLIAPRGLFPKG